MGKKNKGNRGGGGGNRPDAVAATAAKPEIVKAEAQAETPTTTSTNPILTEKPVENGPIIDEIISTPVQVIQEEVQSPKTTEEDAPTKNQTKKNKKNSKQNKQQPAETEQCVKLEQPVREDIGKPAPGATQEEDKSITISSEKQLGSEDNAASKKKKKNRNKNKGNEEKPQNITQPQPSEAKPQNIEDNQALKIENVPQTLSKTQMKKLKKLQRQQEAELLNQESKLQSEVKEVITPLCDSVTDLTKPKLETAKITNTNKKANKESKTNESPHPDNKKEQENPLISMEDQTKIQEKSHPGITLVKKTSSNENILIEKYPNADNLATKAIQINKTVPKPKDSKTQDHSQKTLIQLEEEPIKEVPVNTKQTHKGDKHPKITEKPSKDANLVKASSNTESPLREDQHPKITEKTSKEANLVKASSNTDTPLKEDKHPKITEKPSKDANLVKASSNTESPLREDQHPKITEKPSKEANLVKASSNTESPLREDQHPKITEKPSKEANLVKASSNTDTPLTEDKHPKITEKPSKDANLVKASSNTESPLREDQHPKITEKPSKDANLVKASSNTESPLREDQHPKITEKPSKEANLVKASSNTDTPLKEDKHPKITEKPSKDANLVKASSNTESPLREDQHPKITEKPSKEANLVKASSNTESPLREDQHPKITEKPSKEANLVKASSNTDTPLTEDKHPKITEKPSKDANLVKASSNTESPLREDQHPKITEKPSKEANLVKASSNTESPLREDTHPKITEKTSKEANLVKASSNTDTHLKEDKHPKITEKPSKDANLVKASSNTESPLREDQHPKITEKPSKDANHVKASSNTDTPLKEDKHPKITDKPSKDLVLVKSSDNTEIPLKSDSHPKITEKLHKESEVEKNAINCEYLDNTSEKSEAKQVTCKDNKSQESSCQNKNLQPNAGKSNKGRKSPKPQNKQPMQIKNNKQINETSKEPCLTEQVPLSSPQLVSIIDAKIHEAAPSNSEKSCSQQKRKSPTKGMNKAKQQNQQEEKEKPPQSFSQSNPSEKVNEPLSKTLEKSLENISTVPDAEIIKLFDLVSKDIEKEVEPTLQEKLSTFSVPIAQAGAALANLIDVVEKTEHKIKESVEETKAKEKSKSQSPQTTPKPTAKSDLCKPIDQKDLNDVLSDAILVEATDCLPQTPPLSNNTITEDNPVITKEPVRTGDQPIEIPEQTPSRKSSTDSKNVVRSDFAPSVEVIKEDLVQKTGVKSLLNHASEKLTPKQNIGVQTKISTSPDKTGPVTKPKVPPRPEITKTKFKPIVQAKPKTILPPPLKRPPPIPQSDDEDEEELIEFKFSPRKVFLFTLCQVCQASLVEYTFCPDCQMVAYCGEQHLKDDVQHHKPYCAVIQEIAKKRGGHVYNNAKILSHNDFRNLRVHTLNICESMLKRQLQAYEKEILLFPRLCTKPDCRNWKINELTECNKCRQVTFCKSNDQHLSPNHGDWCSKFLLYQKLVIRQKTVGRIEPPLPSRICTQTFVLNQPIQDVFKELYKNNAVLSDDCAFATLTQLATGPLTTLCAAQTCGMDIGESFVIHLIGAELQFEGESLDKWEAFFLHLIPKLTDLRVVFVGPELNNENLPIEILSRIRMCRMCRTTCRNVKFDFQCGKLYHDYANTNAFTKPDLICFFNPGLYRMTGFCGLDTWPDTIKCAVRQNCPIVVTSYTELESPLDLSQLQKMGNGVNERQLRLIQPPKINPYSSQRPERNFVSDEIAPMIFKNYYHFVVN